MKILNKKTIIIPIVLLMLFSCSKKGEEHEENNNKIEEGSISIKTNIEVQPVKHSSISDTLKITGTIEPWKTVTLSSESNGKIISLNIDEGSWVNAGQLVLETEHDTLLNQLKQAEAAYKQARTSSVTQKRLVEGEVYVRDLTLGNTVTNLERDKKLMKESVLSEKQLDDRKYELNLSKINLELAKIRREDVTTSLVTNLQNTVAQLNLVKIQLNKTYLKSPVSGIVDSLNVDRGEMLGAGTPIANIVQIDKLKVVGGITETDLPYIKIGNTAKIKVDAYPNETFSGSIYYISNSAKDSNKTFDVKISINNSNHKLKPGMIANFDILKAKYDNAVVIPRVCVMPDIDKKYVFVENNNIVQKKYVKLGKDIQDRVIILDGLKFGERLVVVGQQNLADKESVNVVKVR